MEKQRREPEPLFKFVIYLGPVLGPAIFQSGISEKRAKQQNLEQHSHNHAARTLGVVNAAVLDPRHRPLLPGG
ncbi:MAG: hypothetical protein ACK2TV_03705, partial [Anaerolineales bacterium]